MPEPPKSPIFRFLTEKENLAAALEVTRYAEEIREYVADRFWSRLEEAIKKNPTASASFSFTRELADKSDGSFYLIARPQGLPEKAQGLLYTIEAHREHIGGDLLGMRSISKPPAKFSDFVNFNRSRRWELSFKNGCQATSSR